MNEVASPRNIKVIALGATVGLLYGLAIRYGSQVFPNSSVFAEMTLGFMVFLPVAIGFVTILVVEWSRPQPVWMWFLLPWVPVAAGEVATMAAYWEGFICVVMFTPIALGASSLGGVAGGLIARYARSRRLRHTSLVSVMCLPLLISAFEPRLLLHQDTRNVESVIDIQAPPETVWQNIERVPRIQAVELQPSWSHSIGFPDPVEATLSKEGVGGKFFDVLHGEYALDPLPNGRTRLHLTSRHRVSTDFNWYAHLWTDAVMRDLQRRILFVVKERSEKR
jgi:hypothetical protein